MGEERTMTLGLAIREALHQEMERDASVIIMGEDIVGGAGSDEPGAEDSWGGPMGITRGLVGKFGHNRVRDTPISEAGFIGAAVGAAATGLRPIAALMFIDFLASRWIRFTIRVRNCATCSAARRRSRWSSVR